MYLICDVRRVYVYMHIYIYVPGRGSVDKISSLKSLFPERWHGGQVVSRDLKMNDHNSMVTIKLAVDEHNSLSFTQSVNS